MCRARCRESSIGSATWLRGGILTIEPGIYIPPGMRGVPKRFRGIGIRIEDDVVVTRTGVEVLTAKAPKGADDIEALMAHG